MNNETSRPKKTIVCIDIGYGYVSFSNEDDARRYLVGNIVKDYFPTRNTSLRLLHEIQSRIKKDHE